MTYRSFPDAKPLVKPPPSPPDVKLRDLNPEKKRRLWAWVQANDPECEAFLQDPLMRQLCSDFNGSPVLPLDYVARALNG